jgi:hypothetical protein
MVVVVRYKYGGALWEVEVWDDEELLLPSDKAMRIGDAGLVS